MSEEGVERRLTTILAADVVGYSRLMGADEAGALAALKGHREELFDPKAAQYRGRTVKLMGDGALMEFASVVDAVAFAVEVQAAMAARNEAVAEDRSAAHIISDKDERLGQPIVPNGLPLSKIHHAAFDAHLIGIDPDYRLHVSERLLGQHDGSMLEALKQLNGATMSVSGRLIARADGWNRWRERMKLTHFASDRPRALGRSPSRRGRHMRPL